MSDKSVEESEDVFFVFGVHFCYFLDALDHFIVEFEVGVTSEPVEGDIKDLCHFGSGIEGFVSSYK